MMSQKIKTESVSWTKDQEKAIYSDGKDILVAAAAGSGKTAVLVERIIQKISNENNPVNVDELLVVTFTNASAQEMRHRIGVALEKKIAENPQSRFLRKQLSLLNQASISTIHSFCLDVIKKYYYTIDIDPNFRIVDDTEGVLLRDEAMEALLEEEYGKENNEDFFQVVDIFTSDRSDAPLENLILKLYDFSRSNPDPNEWLLNIPKQYELHEEKTIDELAFIDHLLFDIEMQLLEARRLFQEALAIAQSPLGPYKQIENFQDDIQLVDRLIQAKNESFTALYQQMQTIEFTRLKSSRGDDFEQELVEQAKKCRDKGKAIIQKLKNELFSRKPESFLKDLKEMKKPVETLISLVQKFADKYTKLKRERAVVDFSDLEHLCLAILGEKDEKTKSLKPTEIALSYQKKFKEVFVDEYQDTNMVQEMILQLVKKKGEENGNLFMVGDVKQSIYRFRLAEPKLFLDKYQRFTKEGKNSGLRIDLAQNFRSRKEVLDGTNFIFKQIMGVNVGEIEYDENAELKLGAQYPEDEPYPVEFVLLYKENEGDHDDSAENVEEEDGDLFTKEELELSQLEAKYIAQTIRTLIDERKKIYDPKQKKYRTIQYRDIVILFRSFTWVPQLMEELKQSGIPAYANLSTGYFEAAEISTVLSLLKIIDNPYQDIPLTAVLRSPIVGLTEDDLARIRIHAPKQTFYDAVKNYSELVPKTSQEERIVETIQRFLKQLDEWRTLARTHSLSELIWQIYRDTKFYDYVGGLPGGKQRKANLLALFHRARQYEETSFRGLFRFLRFVERIEDRGSDLGEARALGEQEDVVRIMTIHSSKGLEFPVVFVAGLGRSFNTTDLKIPYLLDKEFGFAVKYVNPQKQITYPSIFQLAILRKKKLELIAEEMRILYVALTRAKEKLYLIGSTNNLEKELANWQKHVNKTSWLLADYDRFTSKNYLNWIGAALIRHRDGEKLRQVEKMAENKEISDHSSIWKITMLSEEEIEDSMQKEKDDTNWLSYVKEGVPVPSESKYKKQIEEQLNWTYRYQSSTFHRSKQSVSELKRLKEMRDEQSSDEFIRSFKQATFTRPKFLQEKKLSPTEKGTAMHMVMQHIDLRHLPTKQSIIELIEELQEKELLTSEEANHIEVDRILGFFETDVGRRLINAQWVKREIPFSFALDPKEIYQDWQEGKGDPVFIQGIIDCLFKDEKGNVLIDYKTDSITDRFKNGFPSAIPVLLSRYQTQIQMYKRAIEEIIQEKIDECYLFFFDGSHLLKID